MFICKCSKCGCLFEQNSKQNYCPDCRREYNREYGQTDKGKEAQKKAEKRYEQSEKGKEVRKRYRQSEKGKEVKKKANKRYKQSEKGKKANKRAKNKRRAKKANAEHEPWTPSDIFKRDQGICHICGLPVYDYDEAPNALKPQYDHVWPIDKRGADTPRNVKLSHAHCNAVKNNRWLSEVDREACREYIANVLEELAEELL